MKINEMIGLFDSLDENNHNPFEEAFRHRYTERFDYAEYLPAYKSVFEYAEGRFGMTPSVTLLTMLPAMATALGMNSYISYGVFKTKANSFVINIQPSGKGKTQFSKWLFTDNIYKRDMELTQAFVDELDRLEEIVPGDNSEFKTVRDKDVAVKKWERRRQQLTLTQVTPAALYQCAGQSAVMMNFDELTMFRNVFFPNEPGRKDDNSFILTQLYSEHVLKKSLIGESGRDVLNSSLSLYAHGTTSGVLSMMNPAYLENGTLWRFWFALQENESSVLYSTSGVTSRRNTLNHSVEKPSAFNSAFNQVFESMYNNAADYVFSYSQPALELRDKVEAIFRTMEAIYGDEKQSLKRTIVNKLFATMDKVALLIHSLNNYELFKPGMNQTSLSTNLLDPSKIDADTVEAAFAVTRMIFSNWLDMVAIKNEDHTVEMIDGIRKKSTDSTKKTRPMADYNSIVEQLGGPGSYDIEKWEDAVKDFDYQSSNNRISRKRMNEMLSKNPNLISMNGKKIILKYA